MATVRDRILELHNRGYSRDEIFKEFRSEGNRTLTKTYIAQCLASRAKESHHQRRQELMYEMLLEISAKLELFTQAINPTTLRRAMDRLETRKHPPLEAHPLPPTESDE